MQVAESVPVDPGKAQVVDRVPKVIKEIKFGVLYVEFSSVKPSNVANFSQTRRRYR